MTYIVLPPPKKVNRRGIDHVNDAPLHRLYLHYSELPYSMRVLYTAALLMLGLGYLFALIYLFHTYSGKDGNPMTLSYEDIVIAYSGSGKDSRLESALRGPMSAMLPRDEVKPDHRLGEGRRRARQATRRRSGRRSTSAA